MKLVFFRTVGTAIRSVISERLLVVTVTSGLQIGKCNYLEILYTIFLLQE